MLPLHGTLEGLRVTACQSLLILFVHGLNVLILFAQWQNGTEKSASESGTPPRAPKPANLKSSPKSSPKTTKSPEVNIPIAGLEYRHSNVVALYL